MTPSVTAVCVTNRPQHMQWMQWNFDKQTAKELGCLLILQDPGDGTPLGELRNRALQLVKTERFLWWDDDDWQHPERIGRAAKEDFGSAQAIGRSYAYFLNSQTFKAKRYLHTSPVATLTTYETKAAQTVRIKPYKNAADTKFQMDFRMRYKMLHKQDKFIESVWMRHEYNVSPKHASQHYKTKLEDLVAEVGLQHWRETSAMIRKHFGREA